MKNNWKDVLAWLACGVIFVSCIYCAFTSCNEKPQVQTITMEKKDCLSQPFLSVLVDTDLFSTPPGFLKMTTEFMVRKNLLAAAMEKGIPPVKIYSATKVAREPTDESHIWNVIIGISGVEDVDTLKCIANTLIDIPFVKMVSNGGEFCISKIKPTGK